MTKANGGGRGEAEQCRRGSGHEGKVDEEGGGDGPSSNGSSDVESVDARGSRGLVASSSFR